MDSKFEATLVALEHFDRADQPAVEALRKNDGANLAAFTQARKLAADRVRAAYLSDTQVRNTPENVELMSVDRIREAVGGTLLGRLLGFLP